MESAVARSLLPATRTRSRCLQRERPGDGRPLGLVSAGSLRGGPASHDPYAARAMQVCAAAAASVSSRVLQTGKRALSATGGARSDRGRGKVSATSNRGGERRDSVFSTPDPAELRRLSSTGGKPSVEPDSRPNHGSRWFGMFERSPVVLVGTFICRSRTGARGLQAHREQRANEGLVDVLEHR